MDNGFLNQLSLIKLNNKYIQGYNPKGNRKGYKNNVIVFKPAMRNRDNYYGIFVINGFKIVVYDFEEFTKLLQHLSNSIKSNELALIHVIDLNYWLELKLKSLVEIFEIKDTVGYPKIFKLITNKFELIELDGVIDYEYGEDVVSIYNKILGRIEDGVSLPQIAYSYAYGSYRLFRKKEKKAWNSMGKICEKHGRMGLYVYSLYDEMKELPSLIYTTKDTFNLFKANLEQPVVYIDRHDCWDYYLLTEEFPYTSPIKEREDVSFNRLMELYSSKTCFDFEATFYFEELSYDDRIPIPNCFKLDLNNNSVKVLGTEITFSLFKEFFKGSLLSGVKIKSIFYYKKKGKLPEEYLEAISKLIIDKHTEPAGSIKRLRAKECLKIQIGKGIGNIHYPFKFNSKKLNEGLKEREFVPVEDWNKLIENSFKRRCLTPQISVRCQQHEFLHILRVIKKLYSFNCEILNVDTDGIIYIDKDNMPALDWIIQLNKEIEKKLPENLKEFKVGIWDLEDTYKEFISFGKKQYVLNNFIDEKTIHIAGCCNTSSLETIEMKAIGKNSIVIPRGQRVLTRGLQGIDRETIDFVLKKEET